MNTDMAVDQFAWVVKKSGGIFTLKVVGDEWDFEIKDDKKLLEIGNKLRSCKVFAGTATNGDSVMVAGSAIQSIIVKGKTSGTPKASKGNSKGTKSGSDKGTSPDSQAE